MSRRRVRIVLGAATIGAAVFLYARRSPVSMLYYPLDLPKRFAPGIWLVDSGMRPGLPLRMTVVQLADGSLLLHSPTRFSPALRQALERIGPIRHLVAPSFAHWLFAKAWQDALPNSITYAAPGMRERRQIRRAGLRIDHVLGDWAPSAWAGEIDHAVITGGFGFHEVAMHHRASGTLLMTDLVQNFEPRKLPLLFRPLAKALGNAEPASQAPAYLRALILLRRRPAAAAARRIVAWEPRHIVLAHGRPIVTDAPARLQRSFAWLL